MGSKPKAPPAPPDPAIAAEKARQEAVAIGMADARRTVMYGSPSLVKSQPVAGVSPSRPTETIQTADPANIMNEHNTAVATAIKELQPANDSYMDFQNMSENSGVNMESNQPNLAAQATLASKRDNPSALTGADKIRYDAAKKNRAIGDYINRTRNRVGVAKSGVAR